MWPASPFEFETPDLHGEPFLSLLIEIVNKGYIKRYGLNKQKPITFSDGFYSNPKYFLPNLGFNL